MLKRRILIVDDEEGIRESFKLILADSYSLIFAMSGPDAMEKVNKEAFDLVLLDIKMPKMNGLDLLKEIKKARPGLPVMIVTGYQSVEMAQEAIRNGAADYIPKPFEPKQIQDAVKNTIKID